MSFLSKLLCFPVWVRSGVQPGHAAPKEPTAIEMRDLESQVVERPATRSFWSRLFSCFFGRVKEGRTNPANDCQWAIEPTSDNMAYHSNWQAQASIEYGTDSATINNDGEIETRESLSLGSASLSETLTIHEADSAITKVEGNITARDCISTASADSSNIATVHETCESTQHLQAMDSPPQVHVGTSSPRFEFAESPEAESPNLAPVHKTWNELVNQWHREYEEDWRHKSSAIDTESLYPVASKVTAPTSLDVGMASEGSDVWADIFGGPRAPKCPSAKERLKAKYARPRPFQDVESAGLAAFQSHFFDHKAEKPFHPARTGWAQYQKE